MQQIPAGKYTVQMERAEKLIAKSGKAYWRIDYKILTGDYSGRIVNILCWNEQSFTNHISAVYRHITSQVLSFEKFDLYFERFDNAKYNRLMPNLRKS